MYAGASELIMVSICKCSGWRRRLLGLFVLFVLSMRAVGVGTGGSGGRAQAPLLIRSHYALSRHATIAGMPARAEPSDLARMVKTSPLSLALPETITKSESF